MNKIYLFFSIFSLFTFLIPLSSRGQCTGKVTVAYYNNGTPMSQQLSSGQSAGSIQVCPVAGAQYSFSATSDSPGILTWARVITQGASPATDVVEVLGTATLAANTAFPLNASFTAATTFRIEAAASGSCTDDVFGYITFAPTLTLAPTLSSVCSGGAATLTASGASDGVYTWLANGTVLPDESGNSITVNPTATTTYAVKANTSCGTSSQQTTVTVYDVTVSPSVPTICASQNTTLTASYSGASATYKWYEKGQPTELASAASVQVAPAVTTTYQVVATTTDCNTITREVTVAVGSPTVSISPSAATICSGSSTTLTAISNNPNATFTWSPSTGLSTTTGAQVTASPAANTTYTVTATTCGTSVTSQVTVAVVTAATYAVNPSSASICTGNSTTLTASSNITSAVYRWYRTADMGTILSTNAALTVSPSATTTYRVLTATACGNNSQDVQVIVNTPPTVNVSPASSTIPSGSSVTLRASGASTYSWSPATGLDKTTGSTVSASPTTTTTYTVVGTSAAGCVNAAQVTVTVSQPLPVKLVSFEAAWIADRAVLTWATASELNSDYFGLERSLDGREFVEIGRLAAGTTATGRNYRHADVSLAEAAGTTVYYRLRQVDQGGTPSYSPVRTLVVPAAQGTFSALVFPNPYQEGATVQFTTSAAGPAVLTVRNVLGQTLLTQNVAAVAGTQQVSLLTAAAWPAGVYYLTISCGARQQVVRLSHR